MDTMEVGSEGRKSSIVEWFKSLPAGRQVQKFRGKEVLVFRM
jgi:hypothetical protein